MLTYLILGMTYAFAAAVQPGPFQTYLVSQAVSHGWRRALPAAFSPLLSDGPVILLVLLVLSRMPAWLTQWLRCAGGAFVLYLACGAFKAWRNYDPTDLAHAPSRRQSVVQGALVNLLNPNPYLGWSVVLGPLLLQGWREAPAHGIALLVGFYRFLVLCMAAIIALFAAARGLGPRVSRVLVGVSALALAGFGCYLLWSGLAGRATAAPAETAAGGGTRASAGSPRRPPPPGRPPFPAGPAGKTGSGRTAKSAGPACGWSARSDSARWSRRRAAPPESERRRAAACASNRISAGTSGYRVH